MHCIRNHFGQFFWLILLLLCAGVTSAAEMPTLTLKDLYAQSLLYFPNEKNAAIDERIGQNAIATARGQWYPRVDLSINGVDSDNNDSDYREAKASLRQRLYDRASLLQINAAKTALQVTQWHNVEQRQALFIEIAEVYVAALIQAEQEKLAWQSLRESETLLRMTQKAVELQQKPLLDRLRAEADVAEKQAQLIEAQNLKQDTMKQLRSYLPVSKSPFTLQVFVPTDFADAQKTSLDYVNAASLQRLQLAQEQARQNLAIERSAYYPSAELLWELSQRYSYSRLQSKDVRVDESRFTLSLHWNVFQGFATAYAVDNAQQRIGRAANEYHLAQLNLEKKISKTKALISSIEQGLQALKKVMLARQRSLQTIEKSWLLHLVNVAEVQVETSALAEVKLQIYTQQRNRDMEKLRLLFLMGQLRIAQ